MIKVCVLMSTFNGEKYLFEQVNSIFNQKEVDVYLYVRDDGSNDETLGVWFELQNRYLNRIFLDKGENIGWESSFLKLIYSVPMKFDYYAVADQDDVWDENKLINGIRMFNSSSPRLYTSNVECVDSQLRHLFMLYTSQNDYEEIDNCFAVGKSPYGCTFIWNNSLQAIVRSACIPEKTIAYDQWIHLIARCNGSVIIDRKSYIKHRIHGNNACGVSTNILGRVKKFFRVYYGKKYIKPSSMIREYINLYGVIDNEHAEFVKLVSGADKIINKINLMVSKECRRMCLKGRLRLLFFLCINKV